MDTRECSDQNMILCSSCGELVRQEDIFAVGTGYAQCKSCERNGVKADFIGYNRKTRRMLSSSRYGNKIVHRPRRKNKRSK